MTSTKEAKQQKKKHQNGEILLADFNVAEFLKDISIILMFTAEDFIIQARPFQYSF